MDGNKNVFKSENQFCRIFHNAKILCNLIDLNNDLSIASKTFKFGPCDYLLIRIF